MTNLCHLLSRVHLASVHLTSCSYSHNHTLHGLPPWLTREQRLAQLKTNNQSCITLQTHHTKVSVSEVSTHLHIPGRGDIPYEGPCIPVRALQRRGV